MNPLYSIVTAGALFTTPIQTQTIYVANLSATDGRDAGAYYQVTTLPQIVPVTPIIPLEQPIQESEHEND
jgi:hypothetical protein